MDPKTPKATALERAKQFRARALQEVVKPTGKVLLGMAQELGKAPIKAAMAPTDILSIAATGKPLPPLKVPGLGEVSSYGRRVVELQKEPGYTPAIAALQAGSEGVLDIASAGQIGALARAARTARGAVAAPKVSPAKTNVLQERLGTARDAITRSMTQSIREPSMGLSIKRVGTSADNLTSEARKYKTADEFVKAQGEPLYHGTPYEFTDFKKGKTTFFTPDKNFAEEYGSSKSFARGLDADVKVLERQGKLNLFDSKNPEHIKKIEKLLPDEVGILGVMPGMGGKIPKAELLERIQGTFTHNTPKFAKEATKVGQMFNDMSIKHEGWWRIKEIKKNSVIAEKIENPNYAKNKQDLKVYGTEEFPRSGTYKTKGEPYWKDFEGDKGFEEAVQKAGFDGYKMTEKNSVTYGVFNPEKLLTKSQLTDIWNKAQGGSRGKTNALKKKIDTE